MPSPHLFDDPFIDSHDSTFNIFCVFSGWSRMALTSVKMAELASMPSASLEQYDNGEPGRFVQLAECITQILEQNSHP
jgi:hypothetical protein